GRDGVADQGTEHTAALQLRYERQSVSLAPRRVAWRSVAPARRGPPDRLLPPRRMLAERDEALEQLVDVRLVAQVEARGRPRVESHPDAVDSLQREDVLVGPVVADVQRRRAAQLDSEQVHCRPLGGRA